MSRRRNKKIKATKRPAIKQAPRSGKEPRRRESPESNENRRIHWHLSAIDTAGPWTVFFVSKTYLVGSLIAKLKSYESMRWGEIDRSKSHPVPIQNLCGEAQRRLEEIGQDDVESLFSLRFSGQQRLWGIRDRAAFKILWWDPNHEVCPSEKKHT